jgi:hypothetical protein
MPFVSLRGHMLFARQPANYSGARADLEEAEIRHRKGTEKWSLARFAEGGGKATCGSQAGKRSSIRRLPREG